METHRRTLIGTVALLALVAGMAVAASPASAARYRGKMVEKPPAGVQGKEPLSFKVKNGKGGSRVSDLRVRRLAGTECVISDKVSFPFRKLVRGIINDGRGPDAAMRPSAKVKPNGRFRLRYSVPVVVVGIEVGPINDPPTNRGSDRKGRAQAAVGELVELLLTFTGTQRKGDAFGGKLKVSLSGPGDNTICDSYGKRRWRAKRVS